MTLLLMGGLRLANRQRRNSGTYHSAFRAFKGMMTDPELAKFMRGGLERRWKLNSWDTGKVESECDAGDCYRFLCSICSRRVMRSGVMKAYLNQSVECTRHVFIMSFL